MRANVLFFFQTPNVGPAIALMLESHAFAVTTTSDPAEGLRMTGVRHFDVFVVEVKASANDAGLTFLRNMSAAAPHSAHRTVVISSDPAESVTRELKAIGVCEIVPKPVHEAEILAAVIDCLDTTPAIVN